jgi:hypothetical protein
MSATPAQIAAAEAALKNQANKEISGLPGFEQGMARNALNDALLQRFAKLAADAVVGVTPAASAPAPKASS